MPEEKPGKELLNLFMWTFMCSTREETVPIFFTIPRKDEDILNISFLKKKVTAAV